MEKKREFVTTNGAFCVIYRGWGKTLEILLIKSATREKNFWELPGGGLDLDEVYDQAVKREVLEETGIGMSRMMSPFCSLFQTVILSDETYTQGTIKLFEYRCDKLPDLFKVPEGAENEVCDIKWFKVKDIFNSNADSNLDLGLGHIRMIAYFVKKIQNQERIDLDDLFLKKQVKVSFLENQYTF